MSLESVSRKTTAICQKFYDSELEVMFILESKDIMKHSNSPKVAHDTNKNGTSLRRAKYVWRKL